MDWSREILQDTPLFHVKMDGFRLRFSLQPIHWIMGRVLADVPGDEEWWICNHKPTILGATPEYQGVQPYPSWTHSLLGCIDLALPLHTMMSCRGLWHCDEVNMKLMIPRAERIVVQDTLTSRSNSCSFGMIYRIIYSLPCFLTHFPCKL